MTLYVICPKHVQCREFYDAIQDLSAHRAPQLRLYYYHAFKNQSYVIYNEIKIYYCYFPPIAGSGGTFKCSSRYSTILFPGDVLVCFFRYLCAPSTAPRRTPHAGPGLRHRAGAGTERKLRLSVLGLGKGRTHLTGWSRPKTTEHTRIDHFSPNIPHTGDTNLAINDSNYCRVHDSQIHGPGREMPGATATDPPTATPNNPTPHISVTRAQNQSLFTCQLASYLANPPGTTRPRHDRLRGRPTAAFQVHTYPTLCSTQARRRRDTPAGSPYAPNVSTTPHCASFSPNRHSTHGTPPGGPGRGRPGESSNRAADGTLAAPQHCPPIILSTGSACGVRALRSAGYAVFHTTKPP